MTRRAHEALRFGALVLAAAALAVRCGSLHPAPPPCAPIAPSPRFADLPSDVVWGFADLHAHPAIEVAFHGKLVWGTAVDDAPVNASELPMIDACPVETHDRNATSPIDRAVGAKVFPALSALGGFAHGPVGSFDYRTTSAWPNARDVIHQEMNVSSIRRAYEGGLRLMFASTTDDQSIAGLLEGPNVANGFVPDAEADYESARAQLDLIQRIVSDNIDWMGIARTPAEARDIIRHGRLAIVLSLEMNGLSEDDVARLVHDYGVAHIIPIHLVDNDVGGTAANGDLFNTSSAVASQLYRPDGKAMRYMDVAPSAGYARMLGWPIRAGTLDPAPVYAQLDPISYSSYASLCYESLAACAGTTPTPVSFVELGQRNYRGLCRTKEECAAGERPGAARIRHYAAERMFIDVSHMSWQSVADTLLATRDRPLMASHGDIVHLCEGHPTEPPCVDSQRRPAAERSLDGEQARAIVSRGGVLGLGMSVRNYDARAVLAARGGPLFELNAAAGKTHACVARAGAGGCEAAYTVDVADPSAELDSLHVSTVGGISGAVPYAQPFVRVEMRAQVAPDQYQRRVFVEPLTCSADGCDGTVKLGTRDAGAKVEPASACAPATCDDVQACTDATYTVDDVERVTLEWLYLAGGKDPTNQCRTTWDDDRAPYWTLDRVELDAADGAATTPLATLGPRSPTPFARLGKKRGDLVIYDREDRPSVGTDVLATGHLLRVSMTAAPDSDLIGASPAQPGANVCVTLRASSGGPCEPVAAPPAPGATECPAGWWTLNQRGEWSYGVELYTFARFPGDERSICGLDVAVLDWPATSDPFSVDEARIEAVEDPVGHWIRRYARVEKHVANGHLGALAFGTDFNGLNGMMDISEFPAPADATTASACPVTAGGGDAPSPLSPMRFRNRDGSLGGEVLLEERGLATYGLLADFLAAVAKYPGCGADVHDSLMLSAEATIRMWEAMLDPAAARHRRPLPRASFDCGPVPGLGP
jgi:microsomal dipeptidase-like Zn-dependent dipeptidase